jgi:hypothetical protein
MTLVAPYHSKESQNGFFITLDIPPEVFNALPEEVLWDGRAFNKKKDFHITLIHTKERGEELAALFERFIAEHPVRLESFLGELRMAARGDERTILAPCVAAHLAEFFAEARDTLGVLMPFQPAHVTLYLHNSNRGIFVDSEDDMAALPLIMLPVISQALLDSRFT